MIVIPSNSSIISRITSRAVCRLSGSVMTASLSVGAWKGATTDANGRVTRLDLSNNQLDGTSPMANANRPPQRFYDLDALRAVAMFLGIVLHSSIFVAPDPQPIWPIQDRWRRALVAGGAFTIGLIPVALGTINVHLRQVMEALSCFDFTDTILATLLLAAALYPVITRLGDWLNDAKRVV